MHPRLREANPFACFTQTQLQLQKAMEEDPTVFEYDEVYDDLKRDQEEKKQETKKDSKVCALFGQIGPLFHSNATHKSSKRCDANSLFGIQFVSV